MRSFILAAAALVSACSSGPGSPPAPQAGAAPQSQADQCGAKALAYLVGRPKSEIPVPVDPSQRRVACTACAVTMDYRPGRLNILFDEQTGVVKEVKCG